MEKKLICKLFLLFLLTFNFTASTLKETVMNKLLEVKKQVAHECALKHHVNASVIRLILTNSGIPDEYDAKCWVSCVLQNMGIMVNGKIDWKRGAEMHKMILDSDIDKENTDKIAEICEKEVIQLNDLCELAYNTAICKFKYGKKFGLPSGHWED